MRKEAHQIGDVWIKNEPRETRTFERERLADDWKHAISIAPHGESITNPHPDSGNRLYVNKTDSDTFVCPCGGFIAHVYRLI